MAQMDEATYSEHDTNSEQEGESDSDDSLDNSTSDDTRNFYFLGRDKTTKWKNKKPRVNVRTRSHNIITHLPGSRGVAKQARSETECVKLFPNGDEIVNLISIYTNIYITRIRDNYDREKDARLTDQIEIRALFGILYMIGVNRCSRHNILKLWDNSKEKKLTYVGTVRRNKAEIPKEFLPNKERQICSTVFGFLEDCSLLSYCPKKNKCVLVISSLHMDGRLDEESGEDKKPEMITFYNRTKIGVDLLDQLCRKYDVSRYCRKWPLVILYDLLNIACINGACVYSANRNYTKVVRSDFIENVSRDFIKPQIERRSTIPQLPVALKQQARLLLGTQEQAAVRPQRERTGSLGRCHLCGRARNKSTRRFCKKCGDWVCPDHANDICFSCFQP
nr:unnamed protein product [Callosobruchus analis]